MWHRGAAYVSGRKVSSKRLRYISPISPLCLRYISKVSSKRLGVRKDHAFRFRVRCRNSVGESETSAPLEVRSKRLPPLPTEVRQHVPRAWVETDLDDLLAADAPRRAMHRAAALLEASTAYPYPYP